MKIFFCIALFLAFSTGVFGQDSTAIMPDNMISLNVGVNLLISNNEFGNIEIKNGDFPAPNDFISSNAKNIYMKTNVGYHIAISFKRRIAHLCFTGLYAQIGITYKNLKETMTYFANEYYESYFISGHGNESWHEQYLSPIIGLYLYGKLGKRIGIASGLNFNENILLSGKNSVNLKGYKVQNNNHQIQQPFERQINTNYNFRSEGGNTIIYKLETFYFFSIDYAMKQLSFGIQLKFPFQNYFTSLLTKGHYLAPAPYNPKNYHQAICSLQINYYLK